MMPRTVQLLKAFSRPSDFLRLEDGTLLWQFTSQQERVHRGRNLAVAEVASVPTTISKNENRVRKFLPQRIGPNNWG